MSHDRRLDDPAYVQYPLLATLKFEYEFFAFGVDAATRAAGLFASPRQQRINLLVAQSLIDAASPANTFIGNVAAQREARRTGGKSVLQGVSHFTRDMCTHQGMPDLVDTSSFKVGVNLAVTPGVVVHREELFELLRYDPVTPQVYDVPLLMVPPPIGRYYVLDMAPGRSYVETAVAAGHTVYMISWRNPPAEMGETSFADYVTRGTMAAMDAIPAAKVNMAAVCLGGTLATMTAAYVAALGTERINSLTLIVTLTDFSGDTGAMGAMIDRKAVEDIRAETSKVGFLSAEKMAAGFRYLKPADLIWGPAGRQWLLGEDPPAMDLLTWNADGTRLPWLMHYQYLMSCYVDNDFAEGRMVIGDHVLDMHAITIPLYVVAAEEDHIVPRDTALTGASLTGGPRRLVVARGGHIGGIVAPPSDRAWYKVGDDSFSGPEWFDSVELHRGSWWSDWTEWVKPLAGSLTAPPLAGGNLGAAPGTYVFG